MKSDQIYTLGWVYGLVTKAVPEAEGNLQLAAMRPFTSMAQAIFKMHLHKVNKDVDRKVMEALVGVDFIDITDGTEPVQPIELQGEWQRGFYAARAGKKLDGGYDIAAARKTAGITQADLAKKLGVTQAFISAVEGGGKKAPSEMIQRIKEIIGS